MSPKDNINIMKGNKIINNINPKDRMTYGGLFSLLFLIIIILKAIRSIIINGQVFTFCFSYIKNLAFYELIYDLHF